MYNNQMDSHIQFGSKDSTHGAADTARNFITLQCK